MTAFYSKSGTLVASTVATVQIVPWASGLWVECRTTGTDEMWVTLDGSVPTVAGDNCFLVSGARNFPVSYDANGSVVTVKMISSGTPGYSVSGLVPSKLAPAT